MSETDTPKKKLWDRAAWTDARFFLQYLKPQANVFVPALLALAVTGAMTLVFFNLLGKLVGDALSGDTGPHLVEMANRTTIVLIALVGGQAFIAFWRILLFAKASERALAAVRRDTFGRIIRLPMATLNVRRVGELASRIANDVEAMRETLVSTIPMLIRHSVMLTGGLIFIFLKSVKLSLFMIATIPVVMVLIAIFGARIRKLTRKAQDELAKSQVVVDESLQSIVSVKAFRNETHEIARYNTQLGEFLRTAIRAALPRASFIAFIIFCFSVALTLVIWFAIRMVSRGEIDSAQLAQFGAFSGLVAASFAQFPELMSQLQRALGATERAREILREDIEPEDPDAPKVRFEGAIEMRQVEFAYPTRPDAMVLRDFNLKAEAGQRIALVGPSGSGKTTTISLLYRFYEPLKGEILIDGNPINDMSLTTLRSNFAMVPQEVLLFGGTIAENIAYGKPGANREEVEHAARLANAAQFIESLPEGYDTLVGERGAQLSGGQRQRIAIARAILADPAILILDEATSSLDAESERLVQEALDQLMENRTSIIIAHRLSTVRRCDQILVMSGGAIVERGTHDELVKSDKSLYATLAKLQLE
ncbi:MAG: ATP-binding cassette domain-containing protein [Verrucomicrobiae bacterium]|nr:ATP-binding cassette domain-containing protein [Verrucomicrobiae bacterium]